MIQRERTSVVCCYDNKILVFKGVDPHSGKSFWFLPGGGIEPNESLSDGAIRECLEETGFKVKIVGNALIKKYQFHWNNQEWECITHFFKAELDEPFREAVPVDDVDYNKGPAWRSLSELERDFSYTKEIRDAVLELS